MKLYMKQKVFSFTDRFMIKDSFENNKYYVEGQLFSLGHKLYIYDMNGRELAFVKQRLMTWMPKFEVYVNGNLVTTVVKQFTFFKPSYTLEGINWSIQGEFWQHNYCISDGVRDIAAINKAWLSWGDCYEIDIAEGVDEVLTIATVLAIDCVLEAQDTASSST